MRQGTGRVKTAQTISRVELLASQAERILPIVVLSVAVLLRLYSLDTIPRGLLWDEAHNGLDALRILDGERPIFLTGNFGREALFVYLQAISIAILGQTDLSLRIASALVGILTIVAAYLLARRMFDARVALLTSGWLAVSLWHMIFSRTGLRSISLPLFLAVGFYCLWRGLEGCSAQAASPPGSTAFGHRARPAIWFALGGVVLGLSLYTYSTARFAPFVILALALYLVFVHRQLFQKALPGLVLALALATLVFVPQGIFFIRHPASFLERAHQVSPLNPELSLGNPAKAILDSALRTLGMFAIEGDGFVDRNLPGRPVFDPLSALLMVAGVAISIRRFREPAYGFLLIWLVIMFVPSFLAIRDTPNYLRATGLIPALFILPALATTRLWHTWDSRVSKNLRTLPVLIVALAFLGGGVHAYHSYFVVWPRFPENLRTFNADKLVLLEFARGLARTEQRPIFVASNDYDDPRMSYILSGQPEARYIRAFEAERSLIAPPDNTSASYLLTWTPPHAPMMDKYFDRAVAKSVGIAPSSRPITLHRLLDPRPPFEPGWSVPARFGDQIFVHGFDVPKDVRAGGVMIVRWYWTIVAADHREFAFSNQLFGVDHHRRGQLDTRGYAPNYWPVGTAGITTFEIEIDPETPTGAYWLQVAVYDRGAPEISNLPVFDTNGNQAGNHLRLGPIKVRGLTPVRSSEGPVSSPSNPDNQLPARFDDQIDLQGYNLSVDRLLPGESLDLTLFWAPRGRPMRDYTVFVHILDGQGQLRSQADSPPMAGKYPTSVWDAGEVIEDIHTLSLPTDLPAGEYRIAIGLYDPETGERAQVVDDNGKKMGGFVSLSDLVVRDE